MPAIFVWFVRLGWYTETLRFCLRLFDLFELFMQNLPPNTLTTEINLVDVYLADLGHEARACCNPSRIINLEFFFRFSTERIALIFGSFLRKAPEEETP